MNRLNYRELTLNRLGEAIRRRVGDLPDALAWKFPSKLQRKNISTLGGFHNRHLGERCFIIANGPSLAAMDLARLAHEVTFGMNRIYLLFDKMAFVPTYYTCINELVLDQYFDDISKLPMHKFLNWNRRKFFDQTNHSISYIKLSLGLRDVFCRNLEKPISSGGTVTFAALQLAFYLGFSTVILVGLDHSFSDVGVPNKVETRNVDIDNNHFHPNYFPKGSKWQLPDLQRSESAYALARAAYEGDGRKIYDATIGGKCAVFEKIEYSSLF